jgi:hypothetical protein
VRAVPAIYLRRTLAQSFALLASGTRKKRCAMLEERFI